MASRRSRSGRPSSSPATRCLRSSSPARRTSSAGCCSRASPLRSSAVFGHHALVVWRRRLLLGLALPLVLAASGAASVGHRAEVGGDWTRFGYDAARHNAGPSNTGITAANVRRLRRQRVTLDGTVDASPIYLRGVRIHGARHDAFFVTTSYGRTIAIDAASGSIL